MDRHAPQHMPRPEDNIQELPPPIMCQAPGTEPRWLVLAANLFPPSAAISPAPAFHFKIISNLKKNLQK